MNWTRLIWCRWALLGLIFLQPAWFLWWHPTQHLSAVVLGLAVLPLLIVLPGVWRLQPRPLVIGGLLLLIYFCYAVMEAWASPPARLPALAQIVLVTLYFIALPTIRRRPASDVQAR